MDQALNDLFTTAPTAAAFAFAAWAMWSRVNRTLDHYEATLDLYTQHIIKTLDRIDKRTEQCTRKEGPQ